MGADDFNCEGWPVPETEDLYEVLHLHPAAHPDVIQAAYRRLTLLYHPDRNPSPEAGGLMAQVNRAYEVLSDPARRAAYDRERAAQAPTAGAAGATAGGASAGSGAGSRPPRSAPRNSGRFSITTDDPINPSYFSITTNDPTNPSYFLVVGFNGRGFSVCVDWGKPVMSPGESYSLSARIPVGWQIDSGPHWRMSWWNISGTATFMPASEVAENIQALFAADELTVQLSPSPFGGNPSTASFEVGGFREFVRPVLDRWERGVRPKSAASRGSRCRWWAVAVAAPAIWFLI